MSRHVAVLGACGALGRSVVSKFSGSGGWRVTGIDFAASPLAHQNCVLDPSDPWQSHSKQVLGLAPAAGRFEVVAIVFTPLDAPRMPDAKVPSDCESTGGTFRSEKPPSTGPAEGADEV